MGERFVVPEWRSGAYLLKATPNHLFCTSPSLDSGLLAVPTCGIQGRHESVGAQQKQGVPCLNPPVSMSKHTIAFDPRLALSASWRRATYPSHYWNHLCYRNGKKTTIAICTYNARTLASEAAIEDLMVQAREIKGVGGVGVLVKTTTPKNIDSFEQPTTGMNRKPASVRWTWESPGEGYRHEIDHIGVSKRKRNPRTIINWDLFATLAGFWEDSAMDNIDEEYDRLVEHLHDCTKKAESSKTIKGRLSLETLELIR
ncbi:hypothetical protein RB195_022576 [Necator americanus]|uniref:Uncharacterized protein n=1 Tax=Necator americanus TaxID=51031 RepID=A0ABR1EFT2_NECAM